MPSTGGVNTYISDLMDQLKKKGHLVKLVSYSDIADYYNSSDIQLYNSFYKELFLKLIDKVPTPILEMEIKKYSMRLLLRRIDFKKFDVVHSQDGIASQAYVETGAKLPLVATIHGCYTSEAIYGNPNAHSHQSLYQRYDQFAVDAPLKVITVSSFINQNLPKIDEKKLNIIHNGIDLEFFHPTYATGNKIKITTTGNFLRYKGHDILLRSLQLLKNKGYEYELYMYGKGFELKDEYMKLVKENNLPVYFMDHVSRNELVKHLQNTEVYIQPSRLENCPFSILEAMACGCSVICSNVGGMPEMVRDGYNGLIFETEDAIGLSKHLENLLQYKDLRDRMRRNSRKLAEESFSIEQMVEKTIKVYSSIIKEI